jgi:hypothetical protein
MTSTVDRVKTKPAEISIIKARPELIISDLVRVDPHRKPIPLVRWADLAGIGRRNPRRNEPPPDRIRHDLRGSSGR